MDEKRPLTAISCLWRVSSFSSSTFWFLGFNLQFTDLFSLHWSSPIVHLHFHSTDPSIGPFSWGLWEGWAGGKLINLSFHPPASYKLGPWVSLVFIPGSQVPVNRPMAGFLDDGPVNRASSPSSWLHLPAVSGKIFLPVSLSNRR